MRKFPRCIESPLTPLEVEQLNKVLDDLEWFSYRPIKHRSGAYVEAKVIEYDDLEIDIELKFGVEDDWHDKHTDSIKRETLKILMI